MAIFFDLLKTWGSLVVAFGSFVIAAISLIKSMKAQKLQKQVNELELWINEDKKKKIMKENKKESRVEASVECRDLNNYYLKVQNSGNMTAYDVEASLDEKTYIHWDNSIMPFDELKPNRSFRVPLMLTEATPMKFRVKIGWKDEDNNRLEDEQLISRY